MFEIGRLYKRSEAGKRSRRLQKTGRKRRRQNRGRRERHPLCQAFSTPLWLGIVRTLCARAGVFLIDRV
jgi:hypothetical protein